MKYHNVSTDVLEKTNWKHQHIFKYDNPKRIPKASNMLNMAQIHDGNQKNQKFKQAVHKVMGKLQIEKMRTYTEELKNIDAGNLHTLMKVNQQFLQRSLHYRRNVDMLQRCTLIKTLNIVRISLKGFDRNIETNLSLQQQIKKKTAHYLPNYEKSLAERKVSRDVSCWSHYQVIGKIY